MLQIVQALQGKRSQPRSLSRLPAVEEGLAGCSPNPRRRDAYAKENDLSLEAFRDFLRKKGHKV
jgi:hypothetical protein